MIQEDEYIYIDLGEYLKIASNIDLLRINKDCLIIRIPRIDPHEEINLLMPMARNEKQ